MKKLPTDRQVLRYIFEMYKTAYPGPLGTSGRGSNDPYVPVDVKAVAERPGCDAELIFGRLYYHLDAKHRYKQKNGKWGHPLADGVSTAKGTVWRAQRADFHFLLHPVPDAN
jgi:hypothetical protein